LGPDHEIHKHGCRRSIVTCEVRQKDIKDIVVNCDVIHMTIVFMRIGPFPNTFVASTMLPVMTRTLEEWR